MIAKYSDKKEWRINEMRFTLMSYILPMWHGPMLGTICSEIERYNFSSTIYFYSQSMSFDTHFKRAKNARTLSSSFIAILSSPNFHNINKNRLSNLQNVLFVCE